MNYIDKTLSKDETFIKQAKIFKLSFLDRYIAGALFFLAGVLSLIFMLAGTEPLTFDEGTVVIGMGSVAMCGAGAILLVLLLLCAIYKLIQKITKAAPDAALPSTVLGRFACTGLCAIALGLITYAAMGDTNMSYLVNMIAGIVIGLLIYFFSILRYLSIKLVLTDKRVFGKKNIWRSEAFDAPISKIDNVVIVFSFWGKMFNYATVTIKSVMGDYKIKYVKCAEEFKNLIMDMVNEK